MQLGVEEEMAGRLEKKIGPTVHVSIYKKAEVVRKKGAIESDRPCRQRHYRSSQPYANRKATAWAEFEET